MKNGLSEIEKRALKELVQKINELYGNNLVKIMLYGSKARGDANEYSDIDVLIILKNFNNKYCEIKKILNITREINYIYEILISPSVITEEHYIMSKMPVIFNIRKDGLNLWKR